MLLSKYLRINVLKNGYKMFMYLTHIKKDFQN